MRQRVLDEIAGRLHAAETRGLCWSCGDTGTYEAQVLYALLHEVERHKPEWRETYDGEIQIDRWQRCLWCRHEWPCPTIKDTAATLEVKEPA